MQVEHAEIQRKLRLYRTTFGDPPQWIPLLDKIETSDGIVATRLRTGLMLLLEHTTPQVNREDWAPIWTSGFAFKLTQIMTKGYFCDRSKAQLSVAGGISEEEMVSSYCE